MYPRVPFMNYYRGRYKNLLLDIPVGGVLPDLARVHARARVSLHHPGGLSGDQPRPVALRLRRRSHVPGLRVPDRVLVVQVVVGGEAITDNGGHHLAVAAGGTEGGLALDRSKYYFFLFFFVEPEGAARSRKL